jgi:hypothetical protein
LMRDPPAAAAYTSTSRLLTWWWLALRVSPPDVSNCSHPSGGAGLYRCPTLSSKRGCSGAVMHMLPFMLWEGLRETLLEVNYSIKQQQSMLITMSGILHTGLGYLSVRASPEFWSVALGLGSLGRGYIPATAETGGRGGRAGPCPPDTGENF